MLGTGAVSSASEYLVKKPTVLNTSMEQATSFMFAYERVKRN